MPRAPLPDRPGAPHFDTGPSLHVHGGADSIRAQFEALRGLVFGLAHLQDEAALVQRAVAQAAAGAPLAPDLDPAGASRVAAALAVAASGPLGTRAAVAATDDLVSDLARAITRYTAAEGSILRDDGFFTEAGHFFGGIFGSIADFADGIMDLPLAVNESLFTLSTGPLQKYATDHPGITNSVIDFAALLYGGYGAGARALADLYDDGTPVVAYRGRDASTGATIAPRSLTDLTLGLAHRNDDPEDGAIDIQLLTAADGTRRAIVNLPGVKDWDLQCALIGTDCDSASVGDLGTTLRAMDGSVTTYEQGVLQAMGRAGIRPDDEVMLVGHSLGGLIATNIASHAAGRFTVTHVLTEGAPTGRVSGNLPGGVRMLALENPHDLVSESADRKDNPDRLNITTVQADTGDGRIAHNHDIRQAYLPTAEAADASHNRSIADFTSSAAGYLGGGEVRTEVYHVGRRS